MTTKTQSKEIKVAYKPLTPYPNIREELQQMVQDYKDTVVNEDTFEDAKKVRATIREKRYLIQNIGKDNASTIAQVSKLNKKTAEDLINIIKPVEDRIHEEIKAIEDRKEAEKAERERKDQERRRVLADKANDIKLYVLERISNGLTSDQAAELLATLSDMEITEDKFEDFFFIAEANHREMIELLGKKIEELKVKEAEEYEKVKEEYFEWCPEMVYTPEMTIEDMRANIKVAQDNTRKLADKARKEAEKKEKEAKLYDAARQAYIEYFKKEPKENAPASQLIMLIEEDKKAEKNKTDQERQERLERDKKLLTATFLHYTKYFSAKDEELENQETIELHDAFRSDLNKLAQSYLDKLHNL